MDAVEIGRWLTAAGFGALAVVSVLAYRTRRTPATRWLAVGTGALGLGTALEVLASVVPSPASTVLAVAGLIVLAAVPVVLVRFARRHLRLARPVAIVVDLLVAAAAAQAAIAPTSPPWAFASAWLVSGWSTARALVAVTPAGDGSPVSRRLRIGAVALAAVAVMPTVAVLAFVLTPGALGLAEVAARTVGVLAAATITVGILSPAWLRTAGFREQDARVRSLGNLLASAADPTPVVARIVAAAPGILGGVAAWLTDGRRVQHVQGIAEERASAISAGLPATPEGERITWTDDCGTHVAAPAGDGWLVVCLGGLIAVQSDAELRLLDRLATMAGLAVERARTHERHVESIQRLQAASSLKDDFLATISHELRTPLTAIRGFSELLRTHDATLAPADREGLLDRVISNAADLENLIGGLMDLTTLRERQGARRIGRYDLRDVCDRVVARLRLELDGHEFRFDVDSGEVVTDGAALGDALSQLLTNAAKFSPPGSRITVTGRIEGREVRVAVADQGVGIAPHEHDAVFEPFYRTGDVLTRATRGAGIGLTVVRELATQLGGEVQVSSEPERGATFTLCVARVHPEADPEELPDEVRRWAVRSRHPSAVDRHDLAAVIREAITDQTAVKV